MGSKSVSIDNRSYKALKNAADDYGETMKELLSSLITETLSEYIEPEVAHEDQMDIVDFIGGANGR